MNYRSMQADPDEGGLDERYLLFGDDEAGLPQAQDEENLASYLGVR